MTCAVGGAEFYRSFKCVGCDLRFVSTDAALIWPQPWPDCPRCRSGVWVLELEATPDPPRMPGLTAFVGAVLLIAWTIAAARGVVAMLGG